MRYHSTVTAAVTEQDDREIAILVRMLAQRPWLAIAPHLSGIGNLISEPVDRSPRTHGISSAGARFVIGLIGVTWGVAIRKLPSGCWISTVGAAGAATPAHFLSA